MNSQDVGTAAAEVRQCEITPRDRGGRRVRLVNAAPLPAAYPQTAALRLATRLWEEKIAHADNQPSN